MTLATCDVLVPRVFYARAAPLTGNFCVLLERVPDVVEHTEESGCPIDQARDAVATLARLHANTGVAPRVFLRP